MSAARQKRLEKAQLRVLFQVPFFAPGVARLPVTFVDDPQVPTACTDGESIKWNGKWFDSLPDQVLVTVLCHEVAHCLLGHIWRLPPAGGDHKIANIACDHAVNLMLREFSDMVTAKRLADPFPFPTDKPPVMDPKYKGRSEESIYAELMSAAQGKQPQSGGKGQKPGGSGQGKPNQSGSNGQPDPNSFGEFKPKPQNAAQKAKAKTDWEGTLIQSAAAMKSRGEVPACVDRLVDGIVKPSICWYDLLRSFIREQCSDDWDFLKPAMEYSGAEFILPSLHSEKMGEVVFATDTSGSIDLKVLAQFQTEKQSCLDDMRPRALLDIYCDAKVHKVVEYSPGDTITRDAPGGGGTSFIPVWKEIERRNIKPKCVVFLTDLDGAFGEDPGYPVLWCAYGTKQVAPFGETVHVDQ